MTVFQYVFMPVLALQIALIYDCSIEVKYFYTCFSSLATISVPLITFPLYN